MKFLEKIKNEAEAVLSDQQSSAKEKDQAKTILALVKTVFFASGQRTHWLSAFAEHHNLLTEAKTTLQKEEKFLKKVFIQTKNLK